MYGRLSRQQAGNVRTRVILAGGSRASGLNRSPAAMADDRQWKPTCGARLLTETPVTQVTDVQGRFAFPLKRRPS
jgi:hypothetical protein